MQQLKVGETGTPSRSSPRNKVGNLSFTPQAISALFSTFNTSTKIRIGSDVLRSFSGEGDVVAWIKKVKLVAKLQGIPAVASLM